MKIFFFTIFNLCGMDRSHEVKYTYDFREIYYVTNSMVCIDNSIKTTGICSFYMPF